MFPITKLALILTLPFAIYAIYPEPEPPKVEAKPKTESYQIQFNAGKYQDRYQKSKIKNHIPHLAKDCQNHNLPVEQCVKDLVAMSLQESHGGVTMEGDNGDSWGYYHIQTELHNITRKQAEDIIFSTDWVLDRMIANGYPEYRTWAIGSHNSKTPSVNARYAKSVKLISANLK